MLLQALALAREYSLQYLASETVLNLAFSQVGLICVFTGLQGNVYSGDLDAVFTPVRFKKRNLVGIKLSIPKKQTLNVKAFEEVNVYH